MLQIIPILSCSLVIVFLSIIPNTYHTLIVKLFRVEHVPDKVKQFLPCSQ
jgi:hypothetical protein